MLCVFLYCAQNYTIFHSDLKSKAMDTCICTTKTCHYCLYIVSLIYITFGVTIAFCQCVLSACLHTLSPETPIISQIKLLSAAPLLQGVAKAGRSAYLTWQCYARCPSWYKPKGDLCLWLEFNRQPFACQAKLLKPTLQNHLYPFLDKQINWLC